MHWLRLSSGVGDAGDRTQVVPDLANTLAKFPQVGKDFLGFRLLGELGCGAFGRVYLAQQGDLANRLVALKVTKSDTCEPEALAQLQHTNIVPIYSVHRAGPFHAICMPYFGATTLTDLLRELKSREHLPSTAQELLASATFKNGSTFVNDATAGSTPGGVVKETPVVRRPASNAIIEMLAGRTYIEGVVWVLACLADGLAHAHERGILHRDLKPANILFTDEGQPMLLDFNLSEDLKRAGETPASVGGTLPYMAPENLLAYLGKPVEPTAAADVYSLGIIFFELLTRKHPFSIPNHDRGPEMVREMYEERERAAPDVRRLNSDVSPALASIIKHCLEPDPQRRYQHARQLHEDLYGFMHHRPLRHAKDPSLREKFRRWRRRHPTLVVAVTLAAFAAAIFPPRIAMQNRQIARQRADAGFRTFQENTRSIQCSLARSLVDRESLREQVKQAEKALVRYVASSDGKLSFRREAGLLDDDQQAMLRELVAECSLMMAQAERLLAQATEDPKEREKLLRRALRYNDIFSLCYVAPPRAALMQRSTLMRLTGDARAADRLKAAAQATPLQTAADYHLEASLLLAERKFREAQHLLEEVVHQNPQDFMAQFLKGLCHKHQRQYVQAEACFTSCVTLSPRSLDAYLMRGVTYANNKHFKEARDDFDYALKEQPGRYEIYLERASAREQLEDYEGAIDDLSLAIKNGAPFVSTCMKRSALREKAGDLAGARRDRQQAYNGEPYTAVDWLATGWAKRKHAPESALEDLDRAIALNPLSRAAWHAKAYLLSKKQPEEAIVACNRLLAFFPDDATALRVRGLLHARGGNRELAIADAEAALKLDSNAAAKYQVAGIFAQTSRMEAADAEKAFELLRSALRGGYGKSSLASDVDLAPLRKDTRFQQLVTSIRQGNDRSRS